VPTPFDPRLMDRLPPAVAKAAMDTGVATKPITDWEAYRHELAHRFDDDMWQTTNSEIEDWRLLLRFNTLHEASGKNKL
jgi:malic enzyme